MEMFCMRCGAAREFVQVGDPFDMGGSWWQVWKCPSCPQRRTIIRPQVPGGQSAVR